MTLSVTNQLLGLLLLTTGLGMVIGACLMRLFALGRLQRHYEQWRQGVFMDLQDQRAGQVTRADQPTPEAPQFAAADDPDDDIPVLTRRVELDHAARAGDRSGRQPDDEPLEVPVDG